MMTEGPTHDVARRAPTPDEIVDATLDAIRHSAYSEEVWIVPGIGPARFRSHFLVLGTGVLLDLSVAEIEVVLTSGETTDGETIGLPILQVLGRKIENVVLDDVDSPIVLLEGGVFLKDKNDGFYGNPLLAGLVASEYTAEEQLEFRDFWTGNPFRASH